MILLARTGNQHYVMTDIQATVVFHATKRIMTHIGVNGGMILISILALITIMNQLRAGHKCPRIHALGHP
jgi:hypothetical protein